MKTLTGVCLAFAITTGFVGFFPCAGWMNWFSVPLSGLAAVLGVVGLLTDKEAKDDQGIYFAALIVGTVLGGVFALRCFLGGGIF